MTGSEEHMPAWYEVAFTYFYMAEVASDMPRRDIVTMTSMMLAFSNGDLNGEASPLAGPN